MASFEMRPDEIRRSGAELTAAGESFAETLAQFQQQAAQFDGAWGEDTIGTYIGTAYIEVAAYAFECWQLIADEIADAGDDLGVQADQIEENERQIAETLRG
ncbi:hypothetical protein [Actinoplanes sp. NPDC051851]|uniref:hypothetical protein n=1 Tax=Actinoplanes sp. NPDC051851 TaxID=3154753 RepID=UPI0034124721